MDDGTRITLFHGSSRVVGAPVFGRGNPHNDYGPGFYCTQSRDLACEWACPTPNDGFVNKYVLDAAGLAIADLGTDEYSLLNWLALLVANRRFKATTPLMAQAMDFMLAKHLPDLDATDVVCGYRADDSHFSFARAFLDNRISLTQLERALHLGGLGRQVVLRSRASFEALTFVEAQRVHGSEWHGRRVARDAQARSNYLALAQEPASTIDDVFMLDLMRRG